MGWATKAETAIPARSKSFYPIISPGKFVHIWWLLGRIKLKCIDKQRTTYKSQTSYYYPRKYIRFISMAEWDQLHYFVLHYIALNCTIVVYGSKEVQLCDWTTELQMVSGDCLTASVAVWWFVLKARAACVGTHQPQHHTPVLSLIALTPPSLSVYIFVSFIQTFISSFSHFLSYNPVSISLLLSLYLFIHSI